MSSKPQIATAMVAYYANADSARKALATPLPYVGIMYRGRQKLYIFTTHPAQFLAQRGYTLQARSGVALPI